ncbi:MAG: flippase [Gemmatimonadetes bacterium]|nr:flippase [Gemmatimonadota bacterium]
MSASTGLRWASRFAGNTAVLAASYGLNTVLAAVVAILLIQHLGRDEYGVLTTIYSYLSFFIILTSVGVDTVVQRDVARAPERAAEIVSRALGLRLALSVGSLVLAVLLLPLLRPTPRVAILVIVALASFPFSFHSLFLVRYSVELRMGLPKLVFGVWSILLTLTKLGLIALGAPLAAFVFLEPVSAAVIYAVSRVLGRRSGLDVSPRLDRQGWMGLLRLSWPVAVASLFIQVYLRIDHLMLYRMSGEGAVGLYGAATRLIEFPYVIPVVFMASAFPLLARFEAESADRLRRATELSFRAMALVSLPMAVAIALYGGGVMVLLLGEEFAAAVPILTVLAWAVPPAFANGVLLNRLFSTGHPQVGAWAAGLTAFLNVGLNLALIPRHGGVGAAWATAVSYAAVVPLALAFPASRSPAAMALLGSVFPERDRHARAVDAEHRLARPGRAEHERGVAHGDRPAFRRIDQVQRQRAIHRRHGRQIGPHGLGRDRCAGHLPRRAAARGSLPAAPRTSARP